MEHNEVARAAASFDQLALLRGTIDRDTGAAIRGYATRHRDRDLVAP